MNPTWKKTVYRIKDWQETFENNKSRIIKRPTYVCTPNSHDSLAFARLIDKKDGMAAFGFFNALVQLQSRKEHRDGWLTSDGLPDGKPLQIDDFATMFRRTHAEIEKWVAILTDTSVGWLHVIENSADGTLVPDDGTLVPQHGQRKKERTEQKERTKERTITSSGDEARFRKFYESYPLRKERQAALKAWRKIKPDDELLQKMLEAIESQVAEKAALKARGEFCPSWKNPATWLSKGCWEDEVVCAPSVKPPTDATPAPEDYCASCGKYAHGTDMLNADGERFGDFECAPWRDFNLCPHCRNAYCDDLPMGQEQPSRDAHGKNAPALGVRVGSAK